METIRFIGHCVEAILAGTIVVCFVNFYISRRRDV